MSVEINAYGHHGAVNWAPLTCLDAAAAAVAVGSLNFKSQRARRSQNYRRSDQGRHHSTGAPLSFRSRVRHGSLPLPISDSESKSFRIFSPLLSPPPPFPHLCRPLSPLCSRDTNAALAAASTTIMQNNYCGMRSAVPRRMLTSRACSLVEHVCTSLSLSLTLALFLPFEKKEYENWCVNDDATVVSSPFYGWLG